MLSLELKKPGIKPSQTDIIGTAPGSEYVNPGSYYVNRRELSPHRYSFIFTKLGSEFCQVIAEPLPASLIV